MTMPAALAKDLAPAAAPAPAMRIALFVPDLRGGGVERVRLLLAREFLARGHGVDLVLLRERGDLLPLVPEGARVIDLQADRIRKGFWPLVRYLRGARPDALIASMWPLTVMAPLAARLARFQGRVVISEHSPLSLAYGEHSYWHRLAMSWSQRMAYPLADARVGVSGAIADDLAMLSRLPRTRFTVIHNPAATGRVPAAAACPAALAGRRGPVILTVGTLKPVKRHDLLLQAFQQLPPELRATLCIVGDGPMRAALERQVVDLNLQDRVLLPGFAADPSPWYAHADVFVLASDYEGFGNVLVEALEHGLPVVSTDCPGGPAEILANGRYGRLVPVGNAMALARAIKELLAEMPDPVVLQNRAADFSVEKIAARYLNLISG